MVFKVHQVSRPDRTLSSSSKLKKEDRRKIRRGRGRQTHERIRQGLETVDGRSKKEYCYYW
ncbi:hypothetical protein AAG906_029406 [Vitis piasezkii]